MQDITALSGRTFLRMAFRLTAYQGVMRERALEQVRQEQEGRTPQASSGYQPVQGQQPRQVVPGTMVALQAEPAFRGIFSFSPAQQVSSGDQAQGHAEDLRSAAPREYPELRAAGGA